MVAGSSGCRGFSAQNPFPLPVLFKLFRAETLYFSVLMYFTARNQWSLNPDWGFGNHSKANKSLLVDGSFFPPLSLSDVNISREIKQSFALVPEVLCNIVPKFSRRDLNTTHCIHSLNAEHSRKVSYPFWEDFSSFWFPWPMQIFSVFKTMVDF